MTHFLISEVLPVYTTVQYLVYFEETAGFSYMMYYNQNECICALYLTWQSKVNANVLQHTFLTTWSANFV